MLAPSQQISLLVEKPAVGGAMIARADGQVVLVTGAIPGERVRARIDRVAKGVAHATTVTVEDPSSDRREAPVDPRCGGGLYAHIAYDRQIAIKSLVIADAFARIGRIEIAPPAVEASREDGYRMRARLHAKFGRVGFFREGTHELCDPRSTRQLLPATAGVLEHVSATLRSLRLDTIAELDVSENVDASERVIAFHSATPVDSRQLEGLQTTNDLAGVVIAGAARAPALVFGSPHVVDNLRVDAGRIRLQRHVLSFFQGNRYLLGALITHVLGNVDSGADVIDLYAGAGLFAAASAVGRGARVVAVEGDRHGAADLATNAAGIGSISCVHDSVEAFLARAAPPSGATVVVDPPRTGMSREALEGTLRLDGSRIIYVSCDVATLARDARRIIDAGYRLGSVHAFDLFPNTAHVETVATFDRGQQAS